MNAVAFLPYVGKINRFEMFGYNIWSFYEYVSEMIADDTISKKLEKIFGCYYERKFVSKGVYDDVKIRDIIVISPIDYKEKGYDLTPEDLMNINSIVHVLAFSSSIEISVNGLFTDNFKLECYSFESNNEGFRIYQAAFSKIEYVKFLKPYQATSLFVSVFKTSLVEMLEKAMIYRSHNRIERIFRALELFYYACSIDDRVTHYNRILNLLMSFEVLLQFENKVVFLEMLKIYNVQNNTVLESRQIHIKSVLKTVEASLSQWWGYDLYNLRNDIVHGNKVNWNIEKYGTIENRLKFGGILLKNVIISVLQEMESEIKELDMSFNYSWAYTFDTDEELIKTVKDSE